MVAVHDHDARGDDEKTKDAIYQDLQAIWATVPKVGDGRKAHETNLIWDIRILRHSQHVYVCSFSNHPHIHTQTDDKVDTDLQEFFDIDIAFLPHPRYRADEHALAIQDLKQR